MDSRIESYFGNTLSGDDRREFEKEIRANPDLADQVAFFLSVRNAQLAARRSRLEERHAEWTQLPKQTSVNWGRWIAVAAVVVLICLGVFRTMNRTEPSYRQLAQTYISEDLMRFRSNQMTGAGDSLQQAIRFYNSGDLKRAGALAERLLEADGSHAETQELAGLVSLRLKDYDKAVTYFKALGDQVGLFANPGRFLEAVALFERNGPGDQEKAENLLNEVVEKNLQGKKVVEKWRKLYGISSASR